MDQFNGSHWNTPELALMCSTFAAEPKAHDVNPLLGMKGVYILINSFSVVDPRGMRVLLGNSGPTSMPGVFVATDRCAISKPVVWFISECYSFGPYLIKAYTCVIDSKVYSSVSVGKIAGCLGQPMLLRCLFENGWDEVYE